MTTRDSLAAETISPMPRIVIVVPVSYPHQLNALSRVEA